MNLVGKKILFIGIGFYDYDKVISDYWATLGGVVTYFCQEHANEWLKKLSKLPFLVTFEKQFSKKFVSNNISNFYGYDEVFLIKGDKISADDLVTLKNNNPKATFRLYQWDSLRRFGGDKAIFESFDYIFSFDRLDCEKYGFIFLPLFYRTAKPRRESFQYDISFAGWLHFDRLDQIIHLNDLFLSIGKAVKFHLYTSVKNWFYFNVLKGVKIVFKHKLNYETYLEILDESYAILDLHHPEQDGLTIRTIEALGANRKIITTNSDIQNYDFYNINNCLILGEHRDPTELAAFLSLPYEQINPDIHDSYSFERWLERIFQSIDH
jgi:hypothetical protein